jgi:hypothetical protein
MTPPLLLKVRAPRRMLKKAVQQGRSERGGEEVRTALCVDRSPIQLNLGERRNPSSASDLRWTPPQR